MPKKRSNLLKKQCISYSRIEKLATPFISFLNIHRPKNLLLEDQKNPNHVWCCLHALPFLVFPLI